MVSINKRPVPKFADESAQVGMRAEIVTSAIRPTSGSTLPGMNPTMGCNKSGLVAKW
jgi:hypothetical protein